MSEAADVTVCTPTYNQGHYIASSVASALQQTWPVAAIHVADDASTDDTPDVMRAMADREPRVKYFRFPDNVGLSANLNRLMGPVKTEFVVNLDSDDALLPQYVEALLPLMRANPRAGYGSVAIQRVDGDGRPIAQVFLTRRAGYQGPEETLRASVRGYRVAANIVMYRTAALRDVGWFNAELGYCNDYDLAVRMAAAGWGNVYQDKLLARYRVWTDAAGMRPRRKGAEIDGYRRIFDDVFTPAFRRRGWDETPLGRQRRHLALVHANACFLPHFTVDDRRHLTGLLRLLGPSRALELKLWLLQWGLAPAFERFYKFRGRAKLLLKKGLARLRGVARQTA